MTISRALSMTATSSVPPPHRVETSFPAPADDGNFAGQSPDRIRPQGIGLSGLAGFFAAWIIASLTSEDRPAVLLMEFASLTALPMIILSIVFNRTDLRPSSGLRAVAGPVNVRRCAVKLVGLAATLGSLAFSYWLFPEYAQPRYRVVWEAVRLAAIPLLAVGTAYFVWADRRMADPEDGYWHSGMLVLGRIREVSFPQLRAHAQAWLVKGFFLPFMLSGAAEHTAVLLKDGWNPATFATLYVTTFTVILTIDTVFGAIGYLLTARILDAQIRSTQPTWLGWVSTVICYIPFSQFLHRAFLHYKGEIDWSAWLGNQPLVFLTWGFAILVLQAIYVWATISFGCRFSNLTNRGIIVDGPYRYARHPAYIAKNLSWWLISVPFVAHGDFLTNLKACILLGLTNVIYCVRAKTEERHLSEDPAYRLYSEGIARVGWEAAARRALAAACHRRFSRRLPQG